MEVQRGGCGKCRRRSELDDWQEPRVGQVDLLLLRSTLFLISSLGEHIRIIADRHRVEDVVDPDLQDPIELAEDAPQPLVLPRLVPSLAA